MVRLTDADINSVFIIIGIGFFIIIVFLIASYIIRQDLKEFKK